MSHKPRARLLVATTFSSSLPPMLPVCSEYKEWAIDGTIAEGPRADYDAKRFAKTHFNHCYEVSRQARLNPGHMPHMPYAPPPPAPSPVGDRS